MLDNSSRITEYIVDSAKEYFDYLVENDKGKEEIPVSRRLRKDEHTLMLKFNVKLPNIDYISEILIDGKSFSPGKFHFIMGEDKRSLYAKLSDTNMNLFTAAKKIIFVNDFKALVKKIEIKFRNVKEFHFPTTAPTIGFEPSDFSDISLSDIQLKAVNNIFSSPASYIWGGAGSGKTRHVLAVSIVNYLKNNKKVVLAAPTHIALENALSAIILLAEQHGVSRYLIRRLGTPSEGFSHSFPQCCRVSINESKINDLKVKSRHLQNYVQLKKDILSYYEILNLVGQFSNLQNEYESLVKQQSNNKRKLKSAQTKLRDAEKEKNFYIDRVSFLQKQYSSFSYKIKRFFGLAEDILPDIDKYTRQLDSVSATIKALKTIISDCVKTSKELDKNIPKNSEEIETIRKTLISASKLPLETHEDVLTMQDAYTTYTSRMESEMDSIKILYPSVDFDSAEAIELELETLKKNITQLQEDDTDNTSDVLLYGVTLDALSSWDFSDVSHVFLDEACYACVAKTALLYLCQCPVTFLGDHMQLPPVCEANESDFKDNREKMFLFAENGIFSANIFFKDFSLMFDDYINKGENLPTTLSVSLLNQTHRFGGKMSKILDKFVYNNGFNSALDVETEILIINAPRLEPPKNPRENAFEAKVIASYIAEYAPDDYVVLSPYTNQIKLLRKTLKNYDDVLTVHKSQGQEWNTVILSVTDTNDMWFTNVRNNVSRGKQVLNTALSRAKKTLVIVCDCNYWLTKDNQLITELIKIGTPLN